MSRRVWFEVREIPGMPGRKYVYDPIALGITIAKAGERAQAQRMVVGGKVFECEVLPPARGES